MQTLNSKTAHNGHPISGSQLPLDMFVVSLYMLLNSQFTGYLKCYDTHVTSPIVETFFVPIVETCFCQPLVS